MITSSHSPNSQLFNQRFFHNLLPIPPTHQMPLGTLAPPFELLNITTGQRVKLGDYLDYQEETNFDRWLILAFTRIFTERHYCPLCYPHIQAMNAAYEQLQQQGAEVLMITSTDASQSQIVQQDLSLKMPLLSDPTCHVFRLYQLGQALGAPLPAQFVIDRSGKIRFRHLFSFIEPNASVERLLTVLQQFKQA